MVTATATTTVEQFTGLPPYNLASPSPPSLNHHSHLTDMLKTFCQYRNVIATAHSKNITLPLLLFSRKQMFQE
jgi:hypothetical protein